MVAEKLGRDAIKDIVWTPNDAVKYALDAIEQRRQYQGEGTRTGISVVDEYLLPPRPGELITILAMSSNFKTGFMQFWARHMAGEIVKEGLTDECVVFVTWEQAIEELLIFDLAFTAQMDAARVVTGKITDDEMMHLASVGSRRAVTPVYLVGHSVQEHKKRPRLNLSAVADGMSFLRSAFGMKFRAIFLDYLGQIPGEDGEDRRMQQFENVRRCKDMSLAMGCPVILGVQVNRQVYKESWAMPGMSDAMETSNVEHTSDKMIGLWMPKSTCQIGATLDTKMGALEVTENLLLMRVLKQKMGPAGKFWPLYVNPARNEIAPMQIGGER